MSEKHDKFVKLSEARVSNVLKHIKLVGNLANTSSYEYSETEAKEIISTIDDQVKLLKAKFAPKKTKFAFKRS